MWNAEGRRQKTESKMWNPDSRMCIWVSEVWHLEHNCTFNFRLIHIANCHFPIWAPDFRFPIATPHSGLLTPNSQLPLPIPDSRILLANPDPQLPLLIPESRVQNLNCHS